MDEENFELTNDGELSKIKNFESGEDRLILDAGEFGGGLTNGPLDPEAFRVNTTGDAGSLDHRFIYNRENGKLFFDADGSGPGEGELIAKLKGAPALEAGDIFVFGQEFAPGELVRPFLTPDVQPVIYVDRIDKLFGESTFEQIIIA